MSLAYELDPASYDLAAFRAALPGIKLLDDAVTLKRRSRDYYWFSPIAKALWMASRPIWLPCRKPWMR